MTKLQVTPSQAVTVSLSLSAADNIVLTRIDIESYTVKIV